MAKKKRMSLYDMWFYGPDEVEYMTETTKRMIAEEEEEKRKLA